MSPHTNNLPAGPSETEVRQHFGDKLKPDAKLMRPAYTSIWALEDGTLLWDWRHGFASLSNRLKCIMYVTGPQGSGKTALAEKMRDAVEVEVGSALSRIYLNLQGHVNGHADKQTIIFTSREYHQEAQERLRLIAEELQIHFFFNINLKRK